MDFIEATITASHEAVEIVTAALISLDISGIQIEDDREIDSMLKDSEWDYVDESLLNRKSEQVKIKIYVSKDICGHDIISSLKNKLAELKRMDLGVYTGDLTLDLADVNDGQWLDNWKKYYKPFAIGEKIVVKPEWEKYDNSEGKLVFNINPGLAFGTGQHQTTQLCITQLEKYIVKDVEIVDIGCGSGILSTISLLMGAKRVFATDTDANAVMATDENMKLNNIPSERYEIELGNILTNKDLRKKVGSGYGIVIANIVADVIIEITKILDELLDLGGIFIASGIISQRLDDVYDALEENNLILLDTINKDDWICVVCRNFSRTK